MLELEEQTFMNIAFAVFATYFTVVVIQCVFIIASMVMHALEEKRLEMTHQCIQTEWSDEEQEEPEEQEKPEPDHLD